MELPGTKINLSQASTQKITIELLINVLAQQSVLAQSFFAVTCSSTDEAEKQIEKFNRLVREKANEIFDSIAADHAEIDIKALFPDE